MNIEYTEGNIVITIPDARLNYNVDEVTQEQFEEIAGKSAADGLYASIAKIESLPIDSDVKAALITGNKVEILNHNARLAETKFESKLQRGVSCADAMFTITE